MKTPHAVLSGLSLIAAAIYFKEPFVKPAHAFGGPDHIACFGEKGTCYAFNGNEATLFYPAWAGLKKSQITWNWKTGDKLRDY